MGPAEKLPLCRSVTAAGGVSMDGLSGREGLSVILLTCAFFPLLSLKQDDSTSGFMVRGWKCCFPLRRLQIIPRLQFTRSSRVVSSSHRLYYVMMM